MKLWTSQRTLYTLGLLGVIGLFSHASTMAAGPFGSPKDQNIPEKIRAILEES